MRLPLFLRRFFCQHITISLVPIGASIAANGEVSMTINVTCPDCGFLHVAPMDATEAMREGVAR